MLHSYQHKLGVTEIRIERGLFKRQRILSCSDRFLVVTNRRLYALYKNTVLSKIAAQRGFAGYFFVPGNEKAKSWETINLLCENLIELGFDRSCTLLAFGGGVISDLTGFAASVFMRGISWIAMPTSLLAQVDASIGGKTAINLPMAKNILGAFWHPKSVMIDPELLCSLPSKQMISGLAEVIKYGMLGKPQILKTVKKRMDEIVQNRPNPMDGLIRSCVKIKAETVELDERDRGERRILNFGHTLAHALETHGKYRSIDHGRAVAAGMLFATGIALKIGLCGDQVKTDLSEVLLKAGLFPKKWTYDVKSLVFIMGSDKKRSGGSIEMILPAEIGKVVVKSISLKMLENEAFWIFNNG